MRSEKDIGVHLCDRLQCVEADHMPREKDSREESRDVKEINSDLLRADSPKSSPKCGITEGTHSIKLHRSGRPWEKPGLAVASRTRQLSVNSRLWMGALS